MKNLLLLIILIVLKVASFAQSLSRNGALCSRDGKYVLIAGNDFVLNKDSSINLPYYNDIRQFISHPKTNEIIKHSENNEHIISINDSTTVNNWILYSNDITNDSTEELLRIIIKNDSVYQFRQIYDSVNDEIAIKSVGVSSIKDFFSKYALSINPIDLSNELIFIVDTIKTEGIELSVGIINDDDVVNLDTLKNSSKTNTYNISCLLKDKVLFTTEIKESADYPFTIIKDNYKHWNGTKTCLLYDPTNRCYFLRLGIVSILKKISLGHGENVEVAELVISPWVTFGVVIYNKMGKIEY